MLETTNLMPQSPKDKRSMRDKLNLWRYVKNYELSLNTNRSPGQPRIRVIIKNY